MKIDTLSAELLAIKMTMQRPPRQALLGQPDDVAKVALEAGQVAFDFVAMAADYVLGDNPDINQRGDVSCLTDLDEILADIGNREASARWANLKSKFVNYDKDNRVIRKLKFVRLDAVHPPSTKLMTSDELRVVLSSHLAAPTRDAFLADLMMLRQVCQSTV